MKYIPFNQFSDFFFIQSFEEIKEKLSVFKKVEISRRNELDKEYPCIYILDVDLFIVFNQNGAAVRYVETAQDIIIEGCNLYTTPLSKIKKHFSELDNSIYTDEEGAIESKKFGFIVSETPDKKWNNILIFSNTYLDEDEISPDDIIKFYLG